MRIGLVGLGRIGAFHAGTLRAIPAIDSLVVTDLVPERTKQIVDRYGADGVDSLDALLAAGVDGVIIAASTNAHTSLVPEYVAVSGGMFRDCGVHDFDIIRWITGQEAIEVYAVGINRGADFFREHGDVDTSAAIVTLADGALGVVSNTRYDGRGYDVRLEVHGSRDSVAAGIDAKWPIRSTEPGATYPGGDPHRFFMDRFQPAFRAEFETFLDVVAGERPSPCTVADGLEADWIAEACARSVKEHRPVRIEEVRIP
jgi:myo-inositol 2-dehydrogenase/D-chiro-inositol 1-dehydrogenase